jgi:hypothetical protein
MAGRVGFGAEEEPILLLAHLGLDTSAATALTAPLSAQLTRSSDGLRDAVRLVERARLDVRREEASSRELHESIRERNAQAREYHALTAALLHSLHDAHAERTDAQELLRLSAQNADGARARAATVEAELEALSAERQAALDAAYAAQRRTAELHEYVQASAGAAERARAAAHDARAAFDVADAEARKLLSRRDAALREAGAEEDAAARARARATAGVAKTEAVRAEVDALRARCDAAARARRAADDVASANESALSTLEAEAAALARALAERRAPWVRADTALEDAEAHGVGLVDAALSAVAAESGGGGAAHDGRAAARARDVLARAQAAIDEACARVAEEEAHVALAARRLSALRTRAAAASSALRFARAATPPSAPLANRDAPFWQNDENDAPLANRDAPFWQNDENDAPLLPAGQAAHAPPVRDLFETSQLPKPPAAAFKAAPLPDEAPSPRPQPCRRQVSPEDRMDCADRDDAHARARPSRVADEPVVPAASPFRHVMRNLLRSE